jgi:branched-chain amino acid aminotransferase
LPEFFNQKFLENKIFETAEINNISLNARVKITVFRSGKGKYEPETNDAGWIIKVSPLYRPDYLWNENGLTLGIFEKAQKTCDLSSNFKTTSSLIYVLASLEKIDSSFDESIILNIKGNIADAIYTNIFSVKEKQIFTPPLSEGAVDGVMRKQIIKIIKKMNFKLSEEPLNLESLENADEVFLTNTIKGIIWVKKFRRTQFSCHISFQLFKEINHIINIF